MKLNSPITLTPSETKRSQIKNSIDSRRISTRQIHNIKGTFQLTRNIIKYLYIEISKERKFKTKTCTFDNDILDFL